MNYDDEEARQILCEIRDLALNLYPFPKDSGVDDRYAAAFGMIAGLATEALNAVKANIPLRVIGFTDEIKFGDKL